MDNKLYNPNDVYCYVIIKPLYNKFFPIKYNGDTWISPYGEKKVYIDVYGNMIVDAINGIGVICNREAIGIIGNPMPYKKNKVHYIGSSCYGKITEWSKKPIDTIKQTRRVDKCKELMHKINLLEKEKHDLLLK